MCNESTEKNLRVLISPYQYPFWDGSQNAPLPIMLFVSCKKRLILGQLKSIRQYRSPTFTNGGRDYVAMQIASRCPRIPLHAIPPWSLGVCT